MFERSINLAYQVGSYRAIAEMMRDRIHDLAVAQNDFDRVWATRNLMQLADQFDEAVERFEGVKKAVDTA